MIVCVGVGGKAQRGAWRLFCDMAFGLFSASHPKMSSAFSFRGRFHLDVRFSFVGVAPIFFFSFF